MTQGQTRKGSLVESLVNIAVGCVVALISQILVFPQFGIHVPLQTDIKIMLCFTAISLVRSYWLRRLFNRRVSASVAPRACKEQRKDAERLDAMENMTPEQCLAIIESAATNTPLREAIDAVIASVPQDERSYETRRAIMEGERNRACDEYFKARPKLDFLGNRRIFEAGFQRGFECDGPIQSAQGSDAEFLSKRLARVAKLAGVPMPDMTHEQIAEVAGTILGTIAGKLERAQVQQKADEWTALMRLHSWPAELHDDTKKLVIGFAAAMAQKLAAAERKYGHSNGWTSPDWLDECRKQLLHHVGKGDPRDVANYCAFLWWHNESTASGAGDELPISTDVDVERVAKLAGWNNRHYMTPADYSIWCARMRKFVALSRAQHAAPDQKPVATVRVTSKGYGMELSTYVAYALPEGMHDLFAAPSTQSASAGGQV
jgi:hypothetical protein